MEEVINIVLLIIFIGLSSCSEKVSMKSKINSCSYLKEQNSSLNIGKWQSDSLGNIGYREEVINRKGGGLKLEKGVYKECIKELLGKANKEHNDELVYIIKHSSSEYVREEIYLHVYFKKNRYVSSSLTLS